MTREFEFPDVTFSSRSLYVSKDHEIVGSFIFEISDHNMSRLFILSAHDRQRLINVLEE